MLDRLHPNNWLSTSLRERVLALGDWMPRCLPRWLRRWLAAQRPRLIASPTDAGLAILREVDDERQALGFLAFEPQGSAPWRAEPDFKVDASAVVDLEIPPALLLQRELSLPAQVQDRLGSVLGYELDRLTPFARSEVYYDATVLAAHQGQVRVQLVVCRRDQVKPFLDRLKAAGMPVHRLVWPGGWPRANLLPPAERPRRNQLKSLVAPALFGLVLVFLALAMASPLWQAQQEREQLQQQLRQLRVQAEQVGALNDELTQAQAANAAVLERSRKAPRMSDLLRELTDLLPDETWIQTLNYNDGKVDMRGQSAQATDLIALLEQGPGISDVSFRSPVMQIAISGQERFHIAFSYSRPDAP